MLPRSARASCADSTEHRTDGTRRAGIIRRPGPRTGPRPRPLRRKALLLCVTSLRAIDPRPRAGPARHGADGSAAVLARRLRHYAAARGRSERLRIIAPPPGTSARRLSDLRRGRTGPVTAARPVPDPWTGSVTDHIVVGDRVLLDISFRAVRARLRILARDGVLLRASQEAYGEGITGQMQLAGPAACLTRLAGVGLENLAETDHCAHIALQWEAIAADGKLFAALDADLMLVPAGGPDHHLARPGRSVPAAAWPGWRRAGPGDRAPVCRGGDPQLRGPGGVCACPPQARQGLRAAARRGGRWGTTSRNRRST